jgi:transposase
MIAIGNIPYHNQIHLIIGGNTMLSIGIDISKEKVDIAVYDGTHFILKSYENSTKGVEKMIVEAKQIKPKERTNKKVKSRIGNKTNKNLLFVMEATGTYHLTYANTLYEKGFNAYVVNPLIIKRYGEEKLRRAKTYRADAKLIAEFGYYNIALDVSSSFSYLFVPNSEVSIKIKLMIRTIDQLYILKNRNTNHIEALKQYKAEYSKESIRIFRNLNKEIDKRIKGIEKKIDKLISSNEEYSEMYKRVISIPGIGKRTGSALIGYFDKFKSFENAKQVAAYVGLNPGVKQSGKSIKGKGNISRIGNPYLRKLFYMGALSASQYNMQCKALYERLSLKSKDKHQIFTAVGHKLLRQAFAVIKYERVYDPTY